ncbi:hypothetical protein ACQKH5_07190 [Hyphomonas sp. NPDC076900]|uniref:hypothetical protein n=1 Tax=Hyphomonas sp. NPDC076900 TaxID=3390570 RepID=UPI003D039B44
MAKISHPELFRFANFQPGLRKKVGNNREVMHVRCEHEDQIIGTLHGSAVFTMTRYKPGCLDGYLYLSACGYPTATTAAAIRDFMKAAGLSGGVSFAKGEERYTFGDQTNSNGYFWLIEA